MPHTHPTDGLQPMSLPGASPAPTVLVPQSQYSRPYPAIIPHSALSRPRHQITAVSSPRWVRQCPPVCKSLNGHAQLRPPNRDTLTNFCLNTYVSESSDEKGEVCRCIMHNPYNPAKSSIIQYRHPMWQYTRVFPRKAYSVSLRTNETFLVALPARQHYPTD